MSIQRRERTAAALLLLFSVGCQPAGDQSGTLQGSASADEAAFEFEEVLPGIYHARGTGVMSVGSHGAVIENDEDLLLVDSHISPAAASAILAQAEALTGKPVRYVVNTHYHFDHAHGNQIYPSEVHVIGHEQTREMLLNGGSVGRSYELFVGNLPDQINQLEAALAPMEDGPEKTQAADQLSFLQAYWDEQQVVEPTPPNTTLSQRMTLFRGDREIRLLFFGRGHTGGDVVVHLPAEGVLISGDLLVPGLPYMGDGYLTEWVETLEHLKGLNFEWVLPGHGNPFQGSDRISALQRYMTDLQSRAAALHAQGLSYQEAAPLIDMTDHASDYPSVTEAGVPEITVRRIWDLLNG